MMITQSGRLVLPENAAHPSVEDVAIALGRIPRFGGHTKVWWTVLHHSLVCEEIALHLGRNPLKQLIALWHDAHEAVTGDIPSTWKTDEMKLRQLSLDGRLFRMLGVGDADRGIMSAISLIDQLALFAESWELGPPGIVEYFNLSEEPRFTPVVHDIRKRYGSVNTVNGLGSAAVLRFIKLTEWHQAAITQASSEKGDPTKI